MQVEELYAEYTGQITTLSSNENFAHKDNHYDDPHIQEYWDEP